MSDTTTGYMVLSEALGECDEAFEAIREMIEAGRVYFPASEITGIVKGAATPGMDDRDKLWLKTTDSGSAWYFWNTSCGSWCPVGGASGELVTKYRIKATVTEDIAEYFGCGWELADGSNLLGVDLTPVAPATTVYELDVEGIYGISEITLDTGSGAESYTIT